jgi:hypothetical protein
MRCQGADGGDAVAGENDRQTLFVRRDRAGGAPHQLECGADFGAPRFAWKLYERRSDAVALVGESSLDPGFDQSLRSRAHSLTAMPRIIRYNQELYIHAEKLAPAQTGS